MKILVIYDSVYGNTEKIAKAIGNALGSPEDVEILRAKDAGADHLQRAELVIVGSPTQAFRPLPSLRSFLENLPENALNGKNTAAFDTRIAGKEAGSGGRFVAKLGGYAAKNIADTLKKKGGNLLVPPEGFAVNGKEGPIATGELERAGAWAKEIVKATK